MPHSVFRQCIIVSRCESTRRTGALHTIPLYTEHPSFTIVIVKYYSEREGECSTLGSLMSYVPLNRMSRLRVQTRCVETRAFCARDVAIRYTSLWSFGRACAAWPVHRRRPLFDIELEVRRSVSDGLSDAPGSLSGRAYGT